MSPTPMTRLLLLVTLLISSSSACNNQDKKALLAFRNSFPRTSLTQWPGSGDCCTWDFVACSGSPGRRVTSLTFFNKYDSDPYVTLNGSIPAAIGDLTELESISFSHVAGLEGPIPPQLTKLKKLQYLSIYLTKVSGPVPSFLSRLPALKGLSLANNMLSGAIPISLGDLPGLTRIELYGNRIGGTIPDNLFSKLPTGSSPALDLSNNRLTGVIPRSLGDRGIVSINLQENRLTGDASFLFGKSKPFLTINLAKNGLDFDFSKVGFSEELLYLDISYNKIYGSIPDGITEVPNLRYLDVSHNLLCGKIPSGGNFSLFDVQYYAGNKCLCGTPLQLCKSGINKYYY